MKKKILVIDVGGTHVKLMISRAEKRKFDSGLTMTPREMVTQMQPLLEDWSFAAVTVGFPSPVRAGRILSDPKHLGRGWVGFDFEKALGKPVRIINDAAMQALGSYHGRRMLFLGLGTGLGSALVWNNYVLPLELGICLTATAISLKIISANRAWRGSAKKFGSATLITRSCN